MSQHELQHPVAPDAALGRVPEDLLEDPLSPGPLPWLGRPNSTWVPGQDQPGLTPPGPAGGEAPRWVPLGTTTASGLDDARAVPGRTGRHGRTHGAAPGAHLGSRLQGAVRAARPDAVRAASRARSRHAGRGARLRPAPDDREVAGLTDAESAQGRLVWPLAAAILGAWLLALVLAAAVPGLVGARVAGPVTLGVLLVVALGAAVLAAAAAWPALAADHLDPVVERMVEANQVERRAE
jgi:uncharacterized membrane protein (DUF485 family)